jgi:hypothetical protein
MKLKLRSSRLWHSELSYDETNVSEELVTSIFNPGGGSRFLRNVITTYDPMRYRNRGNHDLKEETLI